MSFNSSSATRKLNRSKRAMVAVASSPCIWLHKKTRVWPIPNSTRLIERSSAECPIIETRYFSGFKLLRRLRTSPCLKKRFLIVLSSYFASAFNNSILKFNRVYTSQIRLFGLTFSKVQPKKRLALVKQVPEWWFVNLIC